MKVKNSNVKYSKNARQNQMNKIKDYYDNLQDWEDEFQPILDEDGQDKTYETYDPYFQQLLDDAIILAGSEDKAYLHIWSRVDGDNGKLILLNGIRKCNRLDYILCKNPWSSYDTPISENIYIESVYED